MVSQNLGPCTLEGNFVRLEPLRANHAGGLWAAAQKLDWSWFLGPLRSLEDVQMRIERGVQAEGANQEFAFAVVKRKDNRIIGSTAYLTTVAQHKRTEIGSTWYLQEEQGTVVNPECKFLLLQHAFEDWGAVRIQLGTDVKNSHSQRAIIKLGAKFEGVLRNHGVRPDGSIRDAMLYSIIDSEWPAVKVRLHERIAAFGLTD